MTTQAYVLPNLIGGTAAISTSGSDAVYGVANLYDSRPGVPFRWLVSTGGHIEIDFGAAVSVGAVGLVGHNLTSGATITLKGGASANPSTLTVSVTWRQYDTWAAVSPAASYRYWRLTVAESNTAVSEIGELVLGALTALPRAHSYGYKHAVNRGMVDHTTELGVTYSARRWKRMAFSLEWRNATASQEAALRAMDAAADGSRIPFLWIPDTLSQECYYVRKQAGYAMQNTSGANWDVGLELSEEHRGSLIVR